MNAEDEEARPSGSNRSRREFLKTSSLGAVAAGVVPASGSPYVATSHEQKKRKPPQGSFPSSSADSITLENAEMRLAIGANGAAQSLLHKPSGQECLRQEAGVPAFSMSLRRRIGVNYPVEARRHLPARSIRRERDRLVVGFEHVDEEVAIGLTIADAYIGFTVEKADPDIADLSFLRLPARDRVHFGEWLNVMWDGEVGTCVLATGPTAHVKSRRRKGYHVLEARAESEVQMEGVGAALLTTQTEHLLDRVAQVEEDFDLPRGVESRRREDYLFSYYWGKGVTPENVDRHIAHAQNGGFRQFMMSYWSFSEEPGHFSWLPAYPNGLDDLRAVVAKIKEAGLTPGLHLHYCKAGKQDPYVKDPPDHRLNLRRTFTLAEPLSKEATTITVEENPAGATLDKERRFLKIGDELVTYEDYTTCRPYQFRGCKRGRLGSQPAAQEVGFKMGVLDVDSWNRFVRFDQRSSLQDDVAERLSEIYDEAGFMFVYYDGAEDVHPPYWFYVSEAQRRVHRKLEPRPLFAEGALAAHFNWHFMTRGNAFDLQGNRPEQVKAATRNGPAAEAPRIAENFTVGNFGWLGYDVPGEETVGTQPDMIEYSTSRAAAWDSPTSIWTDLEPLEEHPRTPDNLEVFRRWEEVRAKGWLTEEQKEALRDLDQEHTLLINEAGDFELVSYERISEVAGGNQALRAFVFERVGKTYVVYWHGSGQAQLEVPLDEAEVRLFEEVGREEVPVGEGEAGVVLPAAGRRYLECTGMSSREAARAFQKAQLRR